MVPGQDFHLKLNIIPLAGRIDVERSILIQIGTPMMKALHRRDILVIGCIGEAFSFVLLSLVDLDSMELIGCNLLIDKHIGF